VDRVRRKKYFTNRKIKYFILASLAIVAILALATCADKRLLNLLVPRSGYTTYSNIPYGIETRQKLDIYVPEKIAKPPTTILFFYGGNWQSGKKEDYHFVGQALASKGFIVVVADYRLYPKVYFPAFMDDGAAALVWVHKHIQSYGGHPNNVFLAGHSAGAYIAVMLTVNKTYLENQGGNLSWIKGTIGIAGPYDFLPFTDPKIKALFSKAKDSTTQPINYVTAGLPPMLLVTGNKDTEVYPKNAIHLDNKLLRYHDPVELIIYPDIGHVGIILSLAYGFRNKSPLLDDIQRFVKHNSIAGIKEIESVK
jgi:acetyl esterase/lipase